MPERHDPERQRAREPAGAAVARLGKRIYRDRLELESDEEGRRRYRIYGDDPSYHDEPGTDFRAIAERRISITPIHLDLTSARRLERGRCAGLGVGELDGQHVEADQLADRRRAPRSRPGGSCRARAGGAAAGGARQQVAGDDQPGQRAVRDDQRRPRLAGVVGEERRSPGQRVVERLGARPGTRGLPSVCQPRYSSASGPAAISSDVMPSNGPASISVSRWSTVTGQRRRLGARRSSRPSAGRAAAGRRRRDRCRPPPARGAASACRDAGVAQLDVASGW